MSGNKKSNKTNIEDKIEIIKIKFSLKICQIDKRHIRRHFENVNVPIDGGT